MAGDDRTDIGKVSASTTEDAPWPGGKRFCAVADGMGGHIRRAKSPARWPLQVGLRRNGGSVRKRPEDRDCSRQPCARAHAEILRAGHPARGMHGHGNDALRRCGARTEERVISRRSATAAPIWLRENRAMEQVTDRSYIWSAEMVPRGLDYTRRGARASAPAIIITRALGTSERAASTPDLLRQRIIGRRIVYLLVYGRADRHRLSDDEIVGEAASTAMRPGRRGEDQLHR